MKQIIKKGFIFSIPFILIFIFLEIRLSQVPTYLSQKKEYLKSQLSEIEVLSTGLSYGNSINPQFIDLKAFNLFNDAEDIYYDVKVIEKYLDQMPRLKLVILPIAYFSLEYRLDQGPWAWRAPFYKFTFKILPQDHLSLLKPDFYFYTFAYGWLEVQNYIKSGFASKITNVLHEDGWREIGTQGIIDSKESDRFGWQSAEFYETHLMNPKNISSEIQLLSSFIEKCQKKQIKVILITPPVFHNLYDHIDPIKYERMQAIINSIANKYQIPYFNFLKDERFNAADFYSIDHVNNLGAEKFSRIINEIINYELNEK